MFFQASQAEVVDKIAATANSEVLMLSDIKKERESLAGKGLVNDLLFQLYDKERLLKSQELLLNFLLDEKIIDSEVKRKNLEVTIERVEQEIRKVAKENGLSRAQFKEALSRQGIKMSDYQSFIKKGLERKSLIDREINSKIRISDEDVAAYYLSTKGPGKAQVYEYTLAHIFFSPQKGGLQAAQDRAREVLKEIKSGALFENVAQRASEDPGFSKGGVLGTFNEKELSPEIKSAVSGANQGAISDLVRTDRGIHIFKVLKKTLVSDPELEERKESIRNILHQRAFSRQLRVWLDQKRSESFIRIN